MNVSSAILYEHCLSCYRQRDRPAGSYMCAKSDFVRCDRSGVGSIVDAESLQMRHAEVIILRKQAFPRPSTGAARPSNTEAAVQRIIVHKDTSYRTST